jgi:hypothetical protein
MAEGTRVAQLAESLAKLKEDYLGQDQKVSKLTDSFNQLRADNQAFQKQTEENLHVIMEALSIKNSLLTPGKELVQGETSGVKDPLIPPNGGGENGVPNSSGSCIPTATDGVGINPRFVNLDFPKFDGEDPTNWVLKAQQFFVYGQIADNQRVPIAYFHMEGKALQWYNWLMESGTVRSWEEFVVALKTRFAPSDYDDPVGAFTKLQQTSTVDEYQSQFEVLSNRILGLTEDFRVSSFVSGLKEEV